MPHTDHTTPANSSTHANASHQFAEPTVAPIAIQDFHLAELPRRAKQVGSLTLGPRSSGGDWQLPYMSVTGHSSGPTLVVFAGVHGDEYEGMEAIPRVYQTVSSSNLQGTLFMVPVCNIAAFEAGARVGSIDSLNLARVYPGNPLGTITEQIAYWTGQRMISQADFFIDLHSGNSTFDIPTLIGYVHDDGELGRQSLAGARAFGAPVLWGHPLPLPPGRTISLATQLGIPSLYTETPGGGRARPADVDCFAQGVLNVLHHLGMLPGYPTPLPLTDHLLGDGNLDQIVTSPVPGRFMARVELLDRVEAGQPLGDIHDMYGRTIVTLEASQAGSIILLRRQRRVETGDGVVQITGIVQ